MVELLQTPVVWENMNEITSGTGFDVDLALLSSSVSELKAMAIEPLAPKFNPLPLNRLLRMVNYETYLTPESRVAFHSQYLPVMQRALWFQQHNPGLFQSPEQEVAAVGASHERACRRLALHYPMSLLSQRHF